MSSMKYYYERTISSSPHAHNSNTTQHIMRDVIIALIPALAGSVYFFGPRALTVTLISMLACFLFEKLWCRFMKQNDKTYDLSACVTGMLLAFTCPPTIEYWQIIIGDFFEGDDDKTGYVQAHPRYRMQFTLEEGKKLPFWKSSTAKF